MTKPGKHTAALQKSERACLRRQLGDGKGLACTEFVKSINLYFTKPRYWFVCLFVVCVCN